MEISNSKKLLPLIGRETKGDTSDIKAQGSWPSSRGGTTVTKGGARAIEEIPQYSV